MIVVRQRNYSVQGGRHLRIRDGRFCIVSQGDYAFLAKFKWFALKSSSSEYVVTRIIIAGKAKTIRMHRLITNCPAAMKVHHENNDTFDNRQENLRVVTEYEHRKFDGWHIFYH